MRQPAKQAIKGGETLKPSKDFARILNRIETAENFRKANFEDRWRANYQIYLSKPPKKVEGRSNIFVPYTFMQVRVIAPRLTESLFANRPYVAVLPREDTDAIHAEKVQTLLDWQFSERLNVRKTLGEGAVENLCIFGTCIVYTGWLVKERKIKRRQEVMEPLLGVDGYPLMDSDGLPIESSHTIIIEKTETVYDDPLVQNIDLFDFFCDPQATTTNDARYLGHKEYQTKEQLQQLVEQGKYKINWKNLTPVTDIDTGAKVRKEDSNISPGEEDFNAKDKNGLYLVHHYWEDNRHMVIINRQEMACDEDNPFWHGEKPYDKCCYVSLPGEFYGLGIPDITVDLQDELNTTRNQRIDYNTMAMRRMWKMRRGCGLTQEDLRWRQNGIIPVNEMDDIQEINIQDLPASAFANEDRIKMDMRDATGCHDIIMGLADTDETATTTMTKDNNASIRFKTIVSAIERDLLVPIAEKTIALDQQFLTENRAVRLLNEDASEIFTISPFEIDGQYDLIYCGSAVEPMANKELTKERILQAYQLAMSDPAYQQDQRARMALLREVFKALEVKNVDDVMPQTQEMVFPGGQETRAGLPPTVEMPAPGMEGGAMIG